jgi:hypothetical protein
MEQAGEGAQIVFLPMLAEMAQSYAVYSEDELRLIVEFMQRTARCSPRGPSECANRNTSNASNEYLEEGIIIAEAQ